MERKLDTLAVIILNYNTPDLSMQLSKQIDAFHTGASIYIIDNCSSDDSKKVLTGHLPHDSHIHLHFCNENTGYANGNNEGVRFAVKHNDMIDTILIINPDIEIDSADTLYAMFRCLHEEPSLGALTVKTIFNGTIREPNDCAWKFMTRKYMAFGGTLIGKKLVKSLKYHELTAQKKNLAYVDVVQGCFFMIKRSVFEQVGLFDPHTFLYTEESILAKKLQKAGYINGVLTDLYIKHNHKEKNKKLIKYRNKLFDMKCYYASRKYYIRIYSGEKKWFVWFSCGFLTLDFWIKKVILRIRTLRQKK